jgi:hypothetical protein
MAEYQAKRFRLVSKYTTKHRTRSSEPNTDTGSLMGGLFPNRVLETALNLNSHEDEESKQSVEG